MRYECACCGRPMKRLQVESVWEPIVFFPWVRRSMVCKECIRKKVEEKP